MLGFLSQLFLTSLVGTDVVFEDGRFLIDYLATHLNLLSKLCEVRVQPRFLCTKQISETYTMHTHRIMSCMVNVTKVFIWY